MKKYVFVFVVLFLVFHSGCALKGYPFLNDKDEITQIEIVKVYNTLDSVNLKIEKILIIEQKSQFLKDFSKIKVRQIIGYAYPIDEGEMAIRFLYGNGDFEIIAISGPGRIRYHVEEFYRVTDQSWYQEKYGDDWLLYYNNSKHYSLVDGMLSLNKKQMETLIQKYLSND